MRAPVRNTCPNINQCIAWLKNARDNIDYCIDNFQFAPIAYSLDMAVTDHTQFIEINDAYSLGYYGGDVELYTKMLDLRWKQIIQNQ